MTIKYCISRAKKKKAKCPAVFLDFIGGYPLIKMLKMREQIIYYQNVSKNSVDSVISVKTCYITVLKAF